MDWDFGSGHPVLDFLIRTPAPTSNRIRMEVFFAAAGAGLDFVFW